VQIDLEAEKKCNFTLT